MQANRSQANARSGDKEAAAAQEFATAAGEGGVEKERGDDDKGLPVIACLA